MNLMELISKLDSHNGVVPLDHLRLYLRSFVVSGRCLVDYANFSNEGYQRTRVHSGEHYDIIYLCWKADQKSPIHDHKGSNCGVRVINGGGVELTFENDQTSCKQLAMNAVTGSFDKDIHQIIAGSSQLSTLHIYSPPLLKMGTYSCEIKKEHDFVDPIVDIGAGI